MSQVVVQEAEAHRIKIEKKLDEVIHALKQDSRVASVALNNGNGRTEDAREDGEKCIEGDGSGGAHVGMRRERRRTGSAAAIAVDSSRSRRQTLSRIMGDDNLASDCSVEINAFIDQYHAKVTEK